ncbi:MAG TPA: hypothetical protein PKY05_11620, partial [Fibrobacteria bacterium]|nr:hypothetical protein [Fibrobacteria bacterium]
RDLLTGDTTTLVIDGNRGRLPLTWAARDTRVLEIPNLRELGLMRTVNNGPKLEPRAKPEPGVMRPDGQWINIIGRRTSQGSHLTWSSPDK